MLNCLLLRGAKTHHPIVPHLWAYKNPQSDFAFGIVLLMSRYHPDQGCTTIIIIANIYCCCYNYYVFPRTLTGNTQNDAEKPGGMSSYKNKEL